MRIRKARIAIGIASVVARLDLGGSIGDRRALLFVILTARALVAMDAGVFVIAPV